MKSRIMETTLQYARSVMNGEFENIREMMLDTIQVGQGYWYKNINAYRLELNISWADLFNMTSMELKRRVRENDDRLWKNEIEKLPTLRIYAKGKNKIGYDKCYRNNANSTYYARARINSLRLDDVVGRGNRWYDRTCKLCRKGREDLTHFLIECEAMESKRNYSLIDRSIKDPEKRLINLLYGVKDHQGVGAMIKSLWFRRMRMMENKKKMEDNMIQDLPRVERGNRSDPGPVGNSHTPMRRRMRGHSAPKG